MVPLKCDEKNTHPFLKKNFDDAVLWKTHPFDACFGHGCRSQSCHECPPPPPPPRHVSQDGKWNLSTTYIYIMLFFVTVSLFALWIKYDFCVLWNIHPGRGCSRLNAIPVCLLSLCTSSPSKRKPKYKWLLQYHTSWENISLVELHSCFTYFESRRGLFWYLKWQILFFICLKKTHSVTFPSITWQ